MDVADETLYPCTFSEDPDAAEMGVNEDGQGKVVEVVILPAAVYDAQQAVIQAAKDWKQKPDYHCEDDLRDALDALEKEQE